MLAFFDQLAKANFQAQPLVVAEQGDYVVDHHRGWSTVGGGLDLTWCLVFRFEAGKIKEVTNFCADQHEADLFFNRVYKLKPIPRPPSVKRDAQRRRSSRGPAFAAVRRCRSARLNARVGHAVDVIGCQAAAAQCKGRLDRGVSVIVRQIRLKVELFEELPFRPSSPASTSASKVPPTTH